MAQVLRQLPQPSHPNLMVGAEHFDDAGVYRLSESLALVQTLDFFPPLVDDPYLFGQIAATNSLSDIYAMGGEPLTALNIVGFPDDKLPTDVLGDILRGGHDKVVEAGAVIVGGHTVRDTEIKYGLSVTGRIDPARVVTNGGARPGDRLILTKPIGSGVLTTAAKLRKISNDDLAEAAAVMTELNAVGRDAMLAHGAHAATDITGFGLLGHANEMAQASGTTVHIRAGAVPIMKGTAHWAQRGCLTRACQSNLAFYGSDLGADGVNEGLVRILADAQTSGGLLIAVPSEQGDALLAALREGRASCAVEIGGVLERGAHAVHLTPE